MFLDEFRITNDLTQGIGSKMENDDVTTQSTQPNAVFLSGHRLLAVLLLGGMVSCGNVKPEFTVAANVGENGSVNRTEVTVKRGETATFTVIPDTGFVIDSVTGCGGSLSGGTFTTDSVEEDCTIVVAFVAEFLVSTDSGANGSVSPSVAVVRQGEPTTFTVTPNTGHIIEAVSGCGGSFSGTVYTIDSVTSNCTVTATFVPTPEFRVTTDSGAHGTIRPNEVAANSGETAVFTITPNADYLIDTVTGCDGALVGNTYTTGSITSDCVVEATFIPVATFTVMTKSGANGSINPGDATVKSGKTATFTVTPSAGYLIDEVTGCNGSLVGNTYTTGTITSNCTVTASFALVPIPEFTVSTKSGANGSMSPNDATVKSGETATFTVTPDAGYLIDEVTGCGGSLVGNTYTTGSITSNCTVTASFTLVPIPEFTVSTKSGANGRMIPSNATVKQGEAVEFAITPDDGYLVGSVTGCGGTLAGSIYTTRSVTSDCTITASFVLETIVAPVFPSAPNWNDYVATHDAKGRACDAETDTACAHAGQWRVVEVADRSDCTDLTAEDALEAFVWECDAGTGNVRFVATELAEGKHLSSLLDFGAPGFKPNQVTVYDNDAPIAVTPSSTWWDNPVVRNNGGGFLEDEGTIYVVTADTQAAYDFRAHKVALVIRPGATVTGLGLGDGFPVIRITRKDYIWLEGVINAFGDRAGVGSTQIRYPVVRNLLVENAEETGIAISASNSVVSQVTAINNNQIGLTIDGDRNTVSRVIAANNGRGVDIGGDSNAVSYITAVNNSENGISVSRARSSLMFQFVANNNGNAGVRLSGSQGNALSDVFVANNVAGGVALSTSADNNNLHNVTATNNGGGGVSISSSNSSIFSAVTAANNGTNGVHIAHNNQRNTLLQIAVFNNESDGIDIEFSNNDITFADVSSANNGGHGAHIDSKGPIASFMGQLRVGNNEGDNCATRNADATCDESPFLGQLTTNIDMANAFVGKVTTEDGRNSSDDTGSASFPPDPSTFDWSRFDNVFRGWGKGNDFLFDNRGQWTTGAGRIWDWNLSATDKGDSGNAPAVLGVVPVPTGTTDDVLTHFWDSSTATRFFNIPEPEDDAGCELLVRGSVWNSTISACQTTFLRRAVEIHSDGIGNDNLLCESGETCLYTPNIASYQGHGDLIPVATISTGPLPNITLVKHKNNGR